MALNIVDITLLLQPTPVPSSSPSPRTHFSHPPYPCPLPDLPPPLSAKTNSPPTPGRRPSRRSSSPPPPSPRPSSSSAARNRPRTPPRGEIYPVGNRPATTTRTTILATTTNWINRSSPIFEKKEEKNARRKPGKVTHTHTHTGGLGKVLGQCRFGSFRERRATRCASGQGQGARPRDEILLQEAASLGGCAVRDERCAVCGVRCVALSTVWCATSRRRHCMVFIASFIGSIIFRLSVFLYL